ncbi:hypothetical protein, partial [Thalassospira xiamenensis]
GWHADSCVWRAFVFAKMQNLPEARFPHAPPAAWQMAVSCKAGRQKIRSCASIRGKSATCLSFRQRQGANRLWFCCRFAFIRICNMIGF